MDTVMTILKEELLKYELGYKKIDISKNIIIFGAAMNGAIVSEYFQQRGYRVSSFCDNNKNLQGLMINGIPCISPAKTEEIENGVIVVCVKNNPEGVYEQLEEMSLGYIVFDRQLIYENIDRWMCICNRFEDEFSKKAYLSILAYRFRGDREILRAIMAEDQYFCIPELEDLSGKEVFVDCGAYCGETMEAYIYKRSGLFRSYYAFEPGSRQYRAMEARKARLVCEWALQDDSLVLENMGIGEKSSLGKLGNDSGLLTSTRIQNDDCSGETAIKIVSLDDYFGDISVSFIKADIEGFEMKMLKGARKVILRDKPRLAISIYHKINDMWEIPEYILTLVPEYKFAVRHHSWNCDETILYGWVEKP